MSAATAGYSGTPLWKKLGLKPGMRIDAIGAPVPYTDLTGPLPEGAAMVADREGLDFIHYFTKEKAALERDFPLLRDRIHKAGMIWISWPKKASKVPTDITEDVIRGMGLAAGMVDVKVCAVDATWSALKFVFRLKDR